MDEESENAEPVEGRVEEQASGETPVPEPTENPGAPARTDFGGGWMWVPVPPPPGGGPVMGPGGQWVGPPGPYWVMPPPPQQRKPHRLTALLVAGLLVIGLGAGFGIGHVVWQSNSTASSPPSTNLPSSGSGTFPFGSGSFPFGSGTFPFGSGSSGLNSSASGAPANATAIAARVDPGLVDVDTNLGYANEAAAGTGIVLTSGGEVLTNNHVIDGATSIRVTDLGNGRAYTATVVGYDRASDVAVLKLRDASGLKVVSLGDSSTVRRGDAVVGIGNAGGLGGTPSVAGGSVTALDQSITATEQDGGNPEKLTGLIEVNAQIEAGDSGGPLVDTAGKVVGMDTAASLGFSLQTTGTDGYAIPINSALAIAKRIESGHASAEVHIGPTAFLGVAVVSSSSPSGAVVREVVPGAPASGAGLVTGDVITSLDGTTVHSAPALTSRMQLYRPGERVKVGWTDSSGGRHSATVQLATGPAA